MARRSVNVVLEEIQRIKDEPGIIYLMRNRDLYKIGITVSLERRIKQLKPDEIVAVKEASNIRGIERLMHARYKHARIPQSEYFRLTKDEVAEAKYLLGGEADKVYIKSSSLAKELKSINKIGSTKIQSNLPTAIQDELDNVEKWLFKSMGGAVLWQYVPLEDDGKPIGDMMFLEFIREVGYRKGFDPVIPKTIAVDEAADRLMVREDIFLNIAKAETLEEAKASSHRLMLDVCLVLCWSVRNGGTTLVDSSNPGDVNSLLIQMEKALIQNGVWYTSRTSINPYWIFLGLASLSCFIFPAFGIPLVIVLAIFNKRLRNSLLRK